MIDLYCERTAEGLLNEPFNLVSNAGFLIAAYFLFKLVEQRGKSFLAYWLILILGAIGIGSGLFHSYAQKWAFFADIVPIGIFQILFLAGYSAQILRLKWFQVICVVLSFLVLNNFIPQLPWPMDGLNGSVAYLTPFIYLSILGFIHWRRQLPEPFILILASGVFLVSLTFRTIDQLVCEWVSWGTHFLWHLLNAFLLYLCGRSCVAPKKV